MPDPDRTVRLLRLADRLRKPAISSAVDSLGLPAGGHGLDVGCGIGSHTELLILATSPGGQVTGVDSSTAHLAVAERSAREKGLIDRVHFQLGSAENLPFGSDSFDWAWSVDCVGFIPGDPVEMIRGLARVVRPRGAVALVLWSSQLLLPGYPLLEARLNATTAGLAPVAADWPPERHFLRSKGWFSQAGLLNPSASSFIVDLCGPLEEDEKEAVASIIEMRWGQPERELSEADWDLFRRVSDLDNADFVAGQSDFFGFFTYTMFWGFVPDNPEFEEAP